MFSFRVKQVPILRTSLSPIPTQTEEFMKSEASELVYNFLLKNADRSVDAKADGVAIVTRLRQEDISSLTGIPLHRVIEALVRLQTEQRLSVESQGTGRPNRYLLRRTNAVGQVQIAL